MGPGQRVEFSRSEEIRMNLNSSILTIEGRGSRDGDMDDEANLVHHAFAVLRYDVASSAYRISSYKDGQFLDVRSAIRASPGDSTCRRDKVRCGSRWD